MHDKRFNNITLKIFSDAEDFSAITSAINKIDAKRYKLNIINSETLEINPNEIIIFQIKNLSSLFYNDIVEIKDIITNKMIFVFQLNDALLVSSIAKLGFNDIFIFPDEISKFISHLKEIIFNNLYKTSYALNSLDDNNNFNFGSLIGNSSGIIKIKELAKKVSEKSSSNILILGETGTGKGLLAKALHKNSPNKDAPFVDIICSAIPENLLESELFGYEPGAFTNAQNLKIGLFELAENGTLFLDEIGDLSLNIQSKLLRAIEKKVIRRLGGIQDIPISARIISATNKNLEEMIKQNLFRGDLYHRLKVMSFIIPPLRKRDHDIVILANYFISIFNKQFKKNVKKLDKDAEDFFLNYKWPGNVRELKNAIERAVLLSDNSRLGLSHFSTIINSIPIKEMNISELSSYHPHLVTFTINYETSNLYKVSKLYAKEILGRMNGNKSKASKFLGISRPKLDSLLK